MSIPAGIEQPEFEGVITVEWKTPLERPDAVVRSFLAENVTVVAPGETLSDPHRRGVGT